MVTDGMQNWEGEIRKALKQHRCVLVICAHDESMRTAVEMGDSIGVCVGVQGLPEVTSIIAASKGKAKIVIAYENDEEAVERASAVLSARELTTCPTIVDRICTSREISPEGIVIRAESFRTDHRTCAGTKE